MTEVEMTKMDKNLKRATLGLLLIFAIFLILFTIRHELLTGDKKPAPIDLQNMTVRTGVSSGIKYTPLESSTLNTPGITKPTFNGNGPHWSNTFYIICFMMLCVLVTNEYYKVALRVERMHYLRALRAERRANRMEKK